MLKKVASLIFSFFVLLSLASLIFNAPLLIAYIKSDSMSPTLQKNDLVFINIFDRNFNEGDIVVFKSDGNWICHRIVKETDEGFITKGDANIATDQFSGRPAVRTSDIIGKIVNFDGDPVNIPLGKGIEKMESIFAKNKLLIFAILMAGGIFMFSGGSKRKGRKYLRIKVSTIFIVSSLLVIVAFSLANVITFEKREISYGTTSAGGLREEWVLPGQEFSRQIKFENRGFYPYYYLISPETANLDLERQGFLLLPGESRVLEVRINAPKDTSLHTEKIAVTKYIPLIPPQIIDASPHPYIPVLLMDLEISFFLAIAYFLGNFEGEVKIRRRWRS